MHVPKLLVLTTLCWVAPLSAQQRPTAPEPMTDKGWACPHEMDSKAIVIAAREPVGEVPFEPIRRAFLP